MTKRTYARPLVIGLAAFLLGGLALPNLRVSWRSPSANAETPTGEISAPPAAPVDISRISPDEVYARAAAIASPSVVNIDTVKQVRVRSSWLDDEMFGPRIRRVPGAGSGVIASADGDILTNAHVVEGTDSIQVTLSDGRSFKGRVVGSDGSTDVALIKVDAKNLPAAHLGTSQGLIPGQLVVAIGNPLLLRFTVTHGIVSALGRPIRAGERTYENLIQTDAPINPGNSGGALINRSGEVIGINTLVMEAANGVGFAIPIDTAKRIVSELKRYGKVKRPWTGLYCEPVTPYVQRYLGLDSTEGALVTRVEAGSPAEEAGVERGDVIAELAGQKIRSDDDVRHITATLAIGTKVKIRVRRGDQVAVGDIAIREAP